MTVTERFATSRYYCLMPVHARGGLTVTKKLDTRFDTHCIKTGVQLWQAAPFKISPDFVLLAALMKAFFA